MADSNITVAGLQATGGVNQIVLSWDSPVDPNVNGLPYLQFAATELWKADTNDRTAPQFVGETSDNSFTHSNLSRGSRYYYWIRPRDRSGLYGEWFPVSPTAGVVGTESNVIDAVLETNGFIRHADGLVEEWGQAFGHTVSPEHAGIVDATFQTTFIRMFHATAFGIIDPAPDDLEDQNAVVHLVSLSTTQMRMRAEAGGTGNNSILVYWRVFGV